MASLIIATLLCFAACSKKSAQGAGQGAAIGGAAGAVGGIVTALVFGGNVGEAAARGAVWAASAGAVTGGIAGQQAHSAEQEKQRQKKMAQLKNELGEDGYSGFLALAECQHDIAIGYARSSAKSTNRDHSLAGIWLEILAEADRGGDARVAELFPTLLAKDDKLESHQQAEAFLAEARYKLQSVRKDYDLRMSCEG